MLVKDSNLMKFNGKYLKIDKRYVTWITRGDKLFKEFFMDINNTLADPEMKKSWIVTDASGEYYKYQTKRYEMYNDLIIIHLNFMQPQFNQIDVKQTTMDKFANFGGNFGIFAEITGVSFLGILNFLILFFKIIVLKH